MSAPPPTLGDEIASLDFVQLLKLGFAGILVYGGYRLVKKAADHLQEDEDE